jgi:uncharacterized protein YjbI with pentapeptide repeats
MANIPVIEIEARAIEFLNSTSAERLSLLAELGLKRYAQLLTAIHTTPGNIICVAMFLSNPERVKFPQLMGTDLTGLNLDQMNLIRANFTGANLHGCSCRDADLIFGNFTNADLTNADLTGATLNETIWDRAILTGCNLSQTIGLTSAQIHNLRSRGAIFTPPRSPEPIDRHNDGRD